MWLFQGNIIGNVQFFPTVYIIIVVPWWVIVPLTNLQINFQPCGKFHEINVQVIVKYAVTRTCISRVIVKFDITNVECIFIFFQYTNFKRCWKKKILSQTKIECLLFIIGAFVKISRGNLHSSFVTAFSWKKKYVFF